MRKILIVSDNPSLVCFFQEECAIQKIDEIADITYHYSAVNKTPSAMIDLGMTPIDFKKHQTIAAAKNLYDLIFSLHCKQIFPPDLIASVTCVNMHPGFNPCNRGWYPQVFSIINSKPIGATIHLMDEAIDHGAIIDQISVDMRSSDTSLDVYERVLDAEKILIRNNLLKIVTGEFRSTITPSEGNYNSIKDFRSLCNLNLDDIASLREHVNLLRALSHGTFKNAFFLDEYGEKVFIRVILEKD
jgi:dTDP-4-amino-4,6-dideoxyglucose formyltransferase